MIAITVAEISPVFYSALVEEKRETGDARQFPEQKLYRSNFASFIDLIFPLNLLLRFWAK
jgi:hypothetical protein